MMKQESKIYFRPWILGRRLTSEKTLVFLTIVKIEEDEENPNSYCAIIDKLDDTVIAVENNVFQAEETVLSMFRDAVDHCLEEDTLTDFLGNAPIMEEIDLPLDKVVEGFNKAIEQARAKQKRKKDHECVCAYVCMCV